MSFFFLQDFGSGETGGRVQPGGVSSAVYAPEVCNSPGNQQPHPDRDRPQRLHRDDQSSEEAADG